MKLSVSIAAVALVLSAGVALAENGTGDARKFFDRLESKGVPIEKKFDADKFWDDLRFGRIKENKPMTSDAFFEQLSAQGVKVPENFDREKFMKDTIEEGVKPPVEIKY